MPHKHTRRKGDDDSKFNLAPSTVAKPLSTLPKKDVKAQIKGKPGQHKDNAANRRDAKSKSTYKHDDTPRAFARMMALQSANKRQRSGLDDGDDRPSKKKKRKQAQTEDNKTQSQDASTYSQAEDAVVVPKIQPGERLADFAARVNHALPVGGLARKGKTNVDGLKERQTKTEKRLHRMYDEWRREEARRKEAEEEKREEEEEAEEEKEAEFGGQSVTLPVVSSKKKRRKMIGEAGEEDDPWAELKAKRGAPARLNDVAQAPPELNKVKEKFKVKGGAKVQVVDVPNKAGSLKRREELSEARREVIERYRAMMVRA